jgi:rod shape-determining protein MreD
MSRERASRHLPFVLTIVAALALTIVPLPHAAEPFRPDWVALTMIFWAFSLPRSYSVGIAWMVGLILDVAQGSMLGQHALALTAVVFLTVRFHLQMRVFPLLQLSATVFALLGLYQFLLFWINGVADVRTPPITYWAPVVSGFLVWPLLYNFLTGIRYRVELRT